MNKREYKLFADNVENIHILIFFITVSAMILVFVYPPLRIYSAIWLVTLWIVERIYGYCPLTVEENKLRRRAGQKVKRTKFIPRFLKKYFGVEFPDWLAELWLTLYFIISLIILVIHF